ncbi:hypothetical protein KC323_g184 [Hortaea werneckii]|nr:hypothetical protein KC323_g184 [Hortaea werneckii]
MRANNAYIPFAIWASAALASPPPTADGCAALAPSDRITCSIQGWHTDIINVNGFIDSAQQAIDSSTPYNYPQEAVFSLGTEGKPCPAPNGCAWDEPVRLAGIETLIPTSDSCGLKALAAVKATFPEVVGNLSAITQEDPSDIATIQDDLAALKVALWSSLIFRMRLRLVRSLGLRLVRRWCQGTFRCWPQWIGSHGRVGGCRVECAEAMGVKAAYGNGIFGRTPKT